jgi:FdhE protein
MTLDEWLDAHPYLRTIGAVHAEIDGALSSISLADLGLPRWDEYAAELDEGVPLLQSNAAAIDLEPAGSTIVALLEKLASSARIGAITEPMRALSSELSRDAASAQRVVHWMLGDDSLEPSSPGLLRFVGWTAMARSIAPIVRAFDARRDEERWLRAYCPTCGAPPAMAQLIGSDPARLRLLACGSCTTRWRFHRTACPFCERDEQKIAVVTIESEPRLRIDSCEPCRAYLKTYASQGEEAIFLADWTSLHLDVIARDRGLIRRAASLYEIDAALQT